MSEETVGLKLADGQDGPRVLTLLKQLSRESKTALFSGLADLDQESASRDLAAWAQRDDGLILLAVAGDQPLGIVTITPQDKSASQGELGLAVLKDYWGNGIGSMLADEAVYWFRNFSSLQALVLEVFKDNQAALAIYHHYGFQTVSQNDQTQVMHIIK